MNKCPHCGATYPEGRKFCTVCGTRLLSPETESPAAASPEPRRVCTRCRLTWPLDAAFCGSCGKAFMGGAAAQPEQGESECCDACGRTLPPGAHFCTRCGMQLPPRDINGVPILLLTEEHRPATLQALRDWCREAGVDPAQHGFCLGRSDVPGSFCLEQKGNRFAFSGVTDLGETHVYYLGRDEAFAVNGFWHTLLHRMGLWVPPESGMAHKYTEDMEYEYT